MPQGLQVWGEDGSLVVDVTSRLTKILGSVNTGTSSGSISLSNLPISGEIWYFSIGNFSSVPNPYAMPPKITLSGTTLSWYVESGIPNYLKAPATIFYGVR